MGLDDRLRTAADREGLRVLASCLGLSLAARTKRTGPPGTVTFDLDDFAGDQFFTCSPGAVPPSAVEVPTLSPAGLLLIASCLGIAALVLLRRWS